LRLNTHWAFEKFKPSQDFYTDRGKPAVIFVLGLPVSFERPAQTQRRKGRELIYPPPLLFITIANTRSALLDCWICEESSKSSEEGERE
jgi:hypothetical protein